MAKQVSVGVVTAQPRRWWVVCLLGLIATLFVKFVAKAQIPGQVNLGSDLVGALTGTGSPITQIFFLIGAAAIFGTDYRWETWRLQTPRNSRLNLMLAKFGVYAGATALALVGMGIGGVLAGIVRAIIEGYGPTLNAVLGVPNRTPNNLIGDGVDSNADMPFLSVFPYIGLPHQGYAHFHEHGATEF